MLGAIFSIYKPHFTYPSWQVINQVSYSLYRPLVNAVAVSAWFTLKVLGEEGAHTMAQLLQSRGIQVDFVLDEGLVITDGIVPGVTVPVAM